MTFVFHKTKYKAVTIVGYSVSEWERRKKKMFKRQQLASSRVLPPVCTADGSHDVGGGRGVESVVVSMVREEALGEEVAVPAGVCGARNSSSSRNGSCGGSSVVSVEVYAETPTT